MAVRIAREAIINGKSVVNYLFYDVLTEEELDLILNPFEMTEPGISGAALFDSENKHFTFDQLLVIVII